jgi:26S proteasome regulatory subunit N5
MTFYIGANHNSSLSHHRYYLHNNDYLEICRCYKAIYDIPAIKEDPTKWIPVLSLNMCIHSDTHPPTPQLSDYLNSFTDS